jgi:uncharacterized protein (TIGR02001 family)
MNYSTKSLMFSLIMAFTIYGSSAYAADASTEPAEPASPHTITSNVGFFSDYVFRGISYTRERGAIQGGFDYSHSSGFYLGVWATNVNKNALYGNSVELDLYGGYIYQFTPDISLNVGFLQFYYPDNDKLAGESANTTEVNAAITYKWLTLKHSYAVTDFFGINSKSAGNGSSRGSGYTELNFNYKLPIQDINLVLHAGRQTVENYSQADYTDFLIGVNKDFAIASTAGWNAGVNYTTTNADDDWYVDAGGFETGDDKVIVYIKRTF